MSALILTREVTERNARATSPVRVDLGCGLDAALLRHVYSTLAETFLAFGRIDFAARFRWLFDLLETRAIAGSANNSVRTSRGFFITINH